MFIVYLFLQIPIVTVDNLVQLNNAIKNMLLYHNSSDPLIEKSLSMICKKLANDYDYLMEMRNDLYFRTTVGNIGITRLMF